MVARTFLPGATCERLRSVLRVDDATWARGRGWALGFGLMCLAHSAGDAVLAGIGRHTVHEVLTHG